MIKNLFFCMFLLLEPFLYSQTTIATKDSLPNNASKDFIFIINPEDCVSCLINTYNLVNLSSDNNVAKKNLILILRDKRKVVEENYEANFRKTMPLDKLTLVWNTELYEKIKKSANRVDETSCVLIFDKKSNKFVFNNITKNTSPADIIPFFERQK